MIKSFLKSLEDPRQRYLGPTIWSLRLTGLVLPNNRIKASIKLFLHFNVFICVVTKLIEAYIIKDDSGLLITNLKITMVSFIGFMKICCFIFFQKKWHQIFDYITAADEYERQNADEARQDIIDKYTRLSRKATYCYWFMMFSTHVAHVGVAIQPLVFATSAERKEFYRNDTVPFPHIFSTWMPFNKQKPPGCWFLLLWHYLACAYGSSVIGAYDAAIVAVMIFFGGKADLLRERSKNLFGKDKMPSNEEFQTNIRNLHRMHGDMLKHFRLLNSLMSPLMFLYVTLCTLMLCLNLFQLTSATDLYQKLLLAEYLIFGVAQLFLVCLPSNNFYIKCKDIAMGPYESEWWNYSASIRQKRDVLLLCGQFRRATMLTAGPFTDLNLPTFVSILKGAYSYYTLLRD